MLSFLSSFSDSFFLAIVLWPLIGALLTIPLWLGQYLRRYEVTTPYAIWSYTTILYVLGLLAFTLYPIPDDPVAYCAGRFIEPRLIPFAWIGDVIRDGKSAVLQVVMNLIFFIPLGVIARRFFGWDLRRTVLLGFAASMFVETAQLTAIFGLYPCRYRYFDVDDLIVNTLGAMVGFAIARYFPRYRNEAEDQSPPTLDIDRRAVAFALDALICMGVALVFTSALYFLGGRKEGQSVDFMLPLGVAFFLSQFVHPYLNRGRTIAGMLLRLTLDDKPRRGLHRFLYYVLHFIAVSIAFFSSNMSLFWMSIVYVLWHYHKIMPYALIDKLFERGHR